MVVRRGPSRPRAVHDPQLFLARREAALAPHRERAAGVGADGVDAALVVVQVLAALVLAEDEHHRAVVPLGVGEAREIAAPGGLEAGDVGVVVSETALSADQRYPVVATGTVNLPPMYPFVPDDISEI
jgi:hypothetical protein